LQKLYFEITRNIVDKLDPQPYFESHQNEGTARTVEKKAALDALSALSQETRLDLFRLLVTVGPQGLPAGVIAERLGVLPSSLTFHLNHLVRAGLITQRRLSRQLIYSAEYGTMNDLLAYLTENCCGRDVLCNAACNPTDAFNTGESDEAPARARQG
jgi:ArsR family transcriptional regulator, arsenate/arsenite/antimonite-responsive transcriptional repressor